MCICTDKPMKPLSRGGQSTSFFHECQTSCVRSVLYPYPVVCPAPWIMATSLVSLFVLHVCMYACMYVRMCVCIACIPTMSVRQLVLKTVESLFVTVIYSKSIKCSGAWSHDNTWKKQLSRTGANGWAQTERKIKSLSVYVCTSTKYVYIHTCICLIRKRAKTAFSHGRKMAGHTWGRNKSHYQCMYVTINIHKHVYIHTWHSWTHVLNTNRIMRNIYIYTRV